MAARKLWFATRVDEGTWRRSPAPAQHIPPKRGIAALAPLERRDGPSSSTNTTTPAAPHAEGNVATQGGPSPLPDTWQKRLDDAERRTRARAGWVAADTHRAPRSSAPFTLEIVAFVQSQLSALDLQYAHILPVGRQSTTVGGASSSSERMTQDSPRLRDRGVIEDTAMMAYLKKRHEVFRRSLAMFADAFSLHRTFLCAVDEELQSYASRLEERCQRLEEENRGLQAQTDSAVGELHRERTRLEAEMARVTAEAARERQQVDAMRVTHMEMVTREKAAAPDIKRQLMEAQLRMNLAVDENTRLKEENSRLSRLVQSLQLETFSDSLQSALEQLRFEQNLRISQEEQLSGLQEGVEDLTRDLRRTHRYLERVLQRPVEHRELRLTKRGTEAVEAEET